MSTRLLSVFLVCSLPAAAPAQITPVEPDDRTASSKAVIVGDVPLLHTAQLLPTDGEGRVLRTLAAQMDSLLHHLHDALAEGRSDHARLVKLNVYAARTDVVPAVQKTLAGVLPARARPAVSFVVGKLPHPDALVALDAVAVSDHDPRGKVKRLKHGSVLPPGAKVYVSGQAEKGSDVSTATRKTLESLQRTLAFLRVPGEQVVQVKAFLTPMTAADEVRREVERFFGKDKAPPLVLVEWRSTLPIEIELVAAAGPARESEADVLAFLTPPGMTASPIFCRVVRVHYGKTVHVSGLYGSGKGDAEVEDLFRQLQDVLKKAGSDLKHLAKATYYCATDGSSAALNKLRPNYYDPKRPPAASKALVAGAGREGHTITLDMIAVPTLAVPDTPPETGHGLTAEEAADGWLSLFDGKTAFGWDGATAKDGVLEGGTTTTTFGPVNLKAEVVRAGSLIVGGRKQAVGVGKLSIPDAGGKVGLADGAAVRSLIVRPSGTKSLFNGKDLDGWKRVDHPRLAAERRPTWKVEEGKLVAVGGPGAVEYQAAKYGELVLQVDVRTRQRHVNGGVFFRSVPGDFMNGYEAQVYNRCVDGDPARPARWATGGIDDRQNARRLVSRDLHFFTLTVAARGPHLSTWVNGHQVTDWTDTRPRHDNPRQGLRTAPGTLQLQAHDPDTDVEFRNIRVQALDR